MHFLCHPEDTFCQWCSDPHPNSRRIIMSTSSQGIYWHCLLLQIFRLQVPFFPDLISLFNDFECYWWMYTSWRSSLWRGSRLRETSQKCQAHERSHLSWRQPHWWWSALTLPTLFSLCTKKKRTLAINSNNSFACLPVEEAMDVNNGDFTASNSGSKSFLSGSEPDICLISNEEASFSNDLLFRTLMLLKQHLHLTCNAITVIDWFIYVYILCYIVSTTVIQCFSISHITV